MTTIKCGNFEIRIDPVNPKSMTLDEWASMKNQFCDPEDQSAIGLIIDEIERNGEPGNKPTSILQIHNKLGQKVDIVISDQALIELCQKVIDEVKPMVDIPF